MEDCVAQVGFKVTRHLVDDQKNGLNGEGTRQHDPSLFTAAQNMRQGMRRKGLGAFMDVSEAANVETGFIRGIRKGAAQKFDIFAEGAWKDKVVLRHKTDTGRRLAA